MPIYPPPTPLPLAAPAGPPKMSWAAVVRRHTGDGDNGHGTSRPGSVSAADRLPPYVPPAAPAPAPAPAAAPPPSADAAAADADATGRSRKRGSESQHAEEEAAAAAAERPRVAAAGGSGPGSIRGEEGSDGEEGGEGWTESGVKRRKGRTSPEQQRQGGSRHTNMRERSNSHAQPRQGGQQGRSRPAGGSARHG